MTDHPPREHGVSSDLRAALGRLTTGEREALISRWGQNRDYWAGRPSALGAVWEVLAEQVADVDRMERARAAGGAEAHTMREARRPRK